MFRKSLTLAVALAALSAAPPVLAGTPAAPGGIVAAQPPLEVVRVEPVQSGEIVVERLSSAPRAPPTASASPPTCGSATRRRSRSRCPPCTSRTRARAGRGRRFCPRRHHRAGRFRPRERARRAHRPDPAAAEPGARVQDRGLRRSLRDEDAPRLLRVGGGRVRLPDPARGSAAWHLCRRKPESPRRDRPRQVGVAEFRGRPGRRALERQRVDAEAPGRQRGRLAWPTCCSGAFRFARWLPAGSCAATRPATTTRTGSTTTT